MTLRFASDDEVADWNTILAQNPDRGNILQGKEFARIKAASGWTPRFLLTDACALLVLEKKLPLLGKIWYCPKGPGITSKDELRALLPYLQTFGREHGVFTIKIEPELDHSIDLRDLGLVKTRYVQAHFSTVLLDLSPSLDEILRSLNQKGRHAIRRAERDGVTVQRVPVTNENCAVMYKLFKETAKDAGFPIRSADYYSNYYKAYGDNGGLFFAYYENEIVAGAFAVVQGQKSMYKDGASIRQRTAYGASHLLQWKVITWAKAHGSTEHDLVGVPPVAEIKNPQHPLYGLGRFKTSFNKTVTEYVGAYDLPVRPMRAKLWYTFGEKLVRKLYFKYRHESFF